MSRLTFKAFRQAVDRLVSSDADLAGVVERYGPPPFWRRPEGFGTLIHLILEQQVSLASAKAANDRLVAVLGEVEPASLLGLDDATLREIGFSRQKAGYARGLARAIVDGDLHLRALRNLDDSAARDALKSIKGIGDWTADCYLLMSLKRSDVWPVGDLALQVSAAQVKRLRKRPTPERLARIGRPWRPWRAVAARMLWHDYLARRRNDGFRELATARSRNRKD